MSPQHWLYAVPLRLRSIFRRRKVDSELEEELQYHLDMKIEEYVAKGMSSEEARRSALLALGGLDQKKEECRDARGVCWLADLQHNFHYSFRRLAKAPLLSLVVILSLGLGIGANTAIFSVMYQILLRPLPVENPEELALGGSFSSFDRFSYEGFRELERRQEPDVAQLAGVESFRAEIDHGNGSRSGSVLGVSGGYFSLMRMQPFMGRTLIPADDRGAGNPVALLGYSYWNNRLGGRTNILNQPIWVGGQVFTLVGVAPKGFYHFTDRTPPDVFIPLAITTSLNTSSTPLGDISLVARIKPGVSREQAAAYYAGAFAANMDAWIQSAQDKGLKGDLAQGLRNHRLRFIDGSRGDSDKVQNESKTPLYILMVATGLVLLIAMANAAGLLLARSAARRGELAICAAMGAGRCKIAGQLLSEALTLAVAGGVAAIPLSLAALGFLIPMLGQAVAPPGFLGEAGIRMVDFLNRIPVGFLTVQLEWPVLLYGLALSLFTGLLFGLYPALEAARVEPVQVLNQESGHASEALGSARVRKALVCAQVMISAMLLIPTGLFLKSLVGLVNVKLGMRIENLITFHLTLKSDARQQRQQNNNHSKDSTQTEQTDKRAESKKQPGDNSEQNRAFFAQVEQELAAIPGVTGVTSALVPLISGTGVCSGGLNVEGLAGARSRTSCYNEISPGFFGQIGIPLMMGREFTERDNPAGQKVAIINQKFAKTFFAGQNSIGRRILLGFHGDFTIVGVVQDSHYSSVKETPPAIFYLPWRQVKGSSMTYYVRSALPLSQAFLQVRKTMQALDTSLPLEDLRTMEDQVKLNMSGDRQIFYLAGIVAALATALAMIGLYGVMAYSVVRRTREIGIRMAIGAKPAGIQKMVLREMLLILAIGLGFGVSTALAISKIVQSQLYGISAYDPLVVAGASLALGLACFAAAFLPAWRASRVDPLNALRCE